MVTALLGMLAAEGAEAGERVVGFTEKAGNVFVDQAWIILAAPLIATFLIGAIGKRLPKGGSEIGILAMSVAGIWSVGLLVTNFIGNARFTGAVQEFEWFPFAKQLSVSFGIQLDGLTAVMFVVVCLISLMVNIYSTSYMHGDSRFTWYFTVLNLFSFSMLLLVAAPNMLQMLMGWELVGICSYLLIGHWWEKRENSDAAIKAVITTRIGDVGFVIGVFVLFVAAGGTFDIEAIKRAAEAGEISTFTLTAGCLLLFAGAAGKSAQFPLYVWLPDAMAGPTPASSLIHAATMVTAGIFMIARLFPIFEASQMTMNVVAIIAVITMLMSALLAMVQEDIKRVLAYSTISQLAYMFAALGVGAGNAAIFHLYTHAWFKALLFQAAGSIIHAVHSNNMGDMGGLKKYMPTTYWTFAAGTLALAGIFPFAGFWSKDEILTEAFNFGTEKGTGIIEGVSHGASADWVALVVYGGGVLTAFLTAFYMSRLFTRVFHGDFHGHGHPHESPKLMTGPLVFLAFMSVVAGLVGIPWWKQGFGTWIAVGGETNIPDANFVLIAVSLAAAFGGLALGAKMYAAHPAVDPLKKLGWFHTLLVNKYYLDDFYMAAVIRPIRDRVSKAMYWLNNHVFDGAVNGAASATRALGRGLYKQVDQRLIDGAVNGAGIGTKATSGRVRFLQTGNVQRYAALLLVGVIVLAVLYTRF